MDRILFYLILFFAPCVKSSEVNSYLSTVEDGIEKFCHVSHFAAKFLEDFNDRHLGKSEWGMILGYEEIKPRITDAGNDRSMKKPLLMALLPLIFHIGAASTWMLLTSIMAVKSVVIGLILLVFRIAVSSAKVGSFFTQLKSKNGDSHTEFAWAPHVIPTHSEWTSYTPDWSHGSSQAYKTIPTYKESGIILEDDFYANSDKIAGKKNG